MVHFVLALSILVAVIGYKNKYVQRFAFVILFVFAALRYMYGNDYSSYYNWYDYVRNGGSSPFGPEVLFTLLYKLVPSFFVLIAMISAVYLLLVYLLISRNLPTEYAWISVFIFLVNPYIFLMNLSALRQCLATCLFILAVDFSYQRKAFKFCVLILIATLFHKSAFILFPLYFIANDKPVRITTCWFLLLATLGILGTGTLSNLALMVANWFEDKNYIYMAQQDMQNSLRATLLTGIYFLYALFNLPKLKGRVLMYAKIYTISPLLGVMAYELSMLTRVQMYFDIFSILALPLIFREIQSRGPIVVNSSNVLITLWDCANKYALPILILAIYLLRYYSFFTNPMWESFFNYQTIFSVL